MFVFSPWYLNENNQIYQPLDKQVWLWPYKAPGIIVSGSYDITIECGSKDMSLAKIYSYFTKTWAPYLWL